MRTGFLGLVCPILYVLCLALGVYGSAGAAEVNIAGEMFGNAEAANTVAQARSFDPMFVPLEKADRDRAAELYEKTMALQPGARVNAVLANRVAQLYAYYRDPKRGIAPVPARAIHWWKRCSEEATPAQLLWGEAQMGVGCTCSVARNPNEAIAAFKAILDWDTEKLKPPDWRAPIRASAALTQRVLEKQVARVRSEAEQLQIAAVDMIRYIQIRVDGATTVSSLLEIARQHKGTPLGRHAAQLAEATLRKPGEAIYRHEGLGLASVDELLAPSKPSEKLSPTSAGIPRTRTTPLPDAQKPREDAVSGDEARGGYGDAGAEERNWLVAVYVALLVGTVVGVAVLMWRARGARLARSLRS